MVTRYGTRYTGELTRPRSNQEVTYPTYVKLGRDGNRAKTQSTRTLLPLTHGHLCSRAFGFCGGCWGLSQHGTGMTSPRFLLDYEKGEGVREIRYHRRAALSRRVGILTETIPRRKHHTVSMKLDRKQCPNVQMCQNVSEMKLYSSDVTHGTFPETSPK